MLKSDTIEALDRCTSFHKSPGQSATCYTSLNIMCLNPGMLGYDAKMYRLVSDLIEHRIDYLYVVYSYQTPIMFAWEDDNGKQFYIPARRYSVTTSRFQNELRNYVASIKDKAND